MAFPGHHSQKGPKSLLVGQRSHGIHLSLVGTIIKGIVVLQGLFLQENCLNAVVLNWEMILFVRIIHYSKAMRRTSQL